MSKLAMVEAKLVRTTRAIKHENPSKKDYQHMFQMLGKGMTAQQIIAYYARIARQQRAFRKRVQVNTYLYIMTCHSQGELGRLKRLVGNQQVKLEKE